MPASPTDAGSESDSKVEAPIPQYEPSGDALLTRGRENTDRLVSSIEKLHADIRDQSTHLTLTLKSLTAAVAGLKHSPQSLDTKTAFWTAYKGLADEYDLEFQRKYGQALDMSLIFAGLFSGVSSAFIIQIQQELHGPDPTQALLFLLVANMTGANAPTSLQPSGPKTIVVVAQIILYISLLSTLLAALLAVLAKQWLLHYGSVGERGTIAERGLERQRKLDGIYRWRFDLVLQIFPLLLQFSLLLFATALSIYLWTIHHLIASIVLVLTGMAFVVYTTMIISALAAQDSPFQTSISTLLKAIWRRIHASSIIHRVRPLVSRSRAAYSHALGLAPGLPIFTAKPRSAEPPYPNPVLPPPPPPSPETSAIRWTLETSTDPTMVEAAAVIIPALSWWPVNFDVQPMLNRLADTFRSSFQHNQLRPGMDVRATTCLKAIIVFERILESPPVIDLGPIPDNFLFQYPKLATIWTLFRGSGLKGPGELVHSMSEWSLRAVAPHQDVMEVVYAFRPDSFDNQKVLAEFLFYVNSSISARPVRDNAILDKSPYKVALTTLLFDNLTQGISQNHPVASRLTLEIIAKVMGFLNSDDNNGSPLYAPGENRRCRTAVYRFCAIPNLPGLVVTFALRFARATFDVINLDECSSRCEDYDVGWVYSMLERSQAWQPEVISDLLQDQEFGPILATPAVWAKISSNRAFAALAERLSSIPECKPMVVQNLPELLAQLDSSFEESRPTLLRVLRSVWGADLTDVGDQNSTLVIVLNALSNAWRDDQFSDSSAIQRWRTQKLLEGTISPALSTQPIDIWIRTEGLGRVDMIHFHRLRDGIADAGARLRRQADEETNSVRNVMKRTAAVLANVASVIDLQLADPRMSVKVLKEFEKELAADVASLSQQQ
ncbi:hypothetical protein C8R46DRAFT_1186780 [Mycena filopes]|nr:hypothetical protein C8R46DRAFT_1186780 [Mycena filopes]